MPDGFSDAAARLAGEPLLQGLLAALATFVLEDPTTVGSGLLVAAGKMSFWTALIGVSAGIAIGDVGLYGVGRVLGPRTLERGWVRPDRFERARGWFRRNLVLAMVVSRFVPGMRLPTYLAAGVLRAPLVRFVGIAVAASIAWTFLLLRLTVALGEAVLPALGRYRWPVALGAIVVLVVLQRRAVRAIESEVESGDRSGAPVLSSFELWSPWRFYAPLVPTWLRLSLRHGGPLTPTAANPSIHAGGLIGESKSAILDLVEGDSRRWIADYVTVTVPAGPKDVADRVERAGNALARAGLGFPLVAKPDVGQRGAGVRPVRGDRDLRDYLDEFPDGGTVVLQRLVGEEDPDGVEPTPDERLPPRLAGVREAGVLYWRHPDDDRGRVFSITLKRFPFVVGDGRGTLRQRIEADPRARHVRDVYFRRLAGRLDEVVPAGERVPLVFSGNHCQGAEFADGTDLVTAAVEARFHDIAASMREFWFGRFDVRFRDPSRFLAGDGFRIVEINGAGAEATHIWDPAMSLERARATLREQYRILFELGAANRRRGFRSVAPVRFLRDVVSYRRASRRYPATW